MLLDKGLIRLRNLVELLSKAKTALENACITQHPTVILSGLHRHQHRVLLLIGGDERSKVGVCGLLHLEFLSRRGISVLSSVSECLQAIIIPSNSKLTLVECLTLTSERWQLH